MLFLNGVNGNKLIKWKQLLGNKNGNIVSNCAFSRWCQWKHFGISIYWTIDDIFCFNLLKFRLYILLQYKFFPSVKRNIIESLYIKEFNLKCRKTWKGNNIKQLLDNRNGNKLIYIYIYIFVKIHPLKLCFLELVLMETFWNFYLFKNRLYILF